MVNTEELKSDPRHTCMSDSKIHILSQAFKTSDRKINQKKVRVCIYDRQMWVLEKQMCLVQMLELHGISGAKTT